MKKLLYFSQTDWDWIAQRPQFMALELERRYDVTVLYPKFLTGGSNRVKNTRRPANGKAVTQIPFQERNAVARFFGDRNFQKAIGNIYEYDILWFCNPLFFRFVPEDYGGIVVYDYMDDIVRLQTSETVAVRTRRYQEKLFHRADHIFTTATYLMNGLEEELRQKATLVRNAFTGETVIPPVHTADAAIVVDGKKNRYRLTYIGTVSEWMDFGLLEKSLVTFPDIEYHFYGPVTVPEPQHERFIFHGVVEHDALPSVARNADALIMPFVLNEVVLAVDPVKLYEYVSLGKCILSVRYPEVEPFAPFAEMYRGEEAYLKLLRQLIDTNFPVKYDEDMQTEFLRNSTWHERANEVFRVLDALTR